MKTFEEYLEEFKNEINKGYREATMVTALCGHIHSSKKPPDSLTMLDEPATASMSFAGVPVVAVNIKNRNVKPLNAGFNFDLKDWADKPENLAMGTFMSELGKEVADREYWIIVNGMNAYAGNTLNSKQKGQLSKDDISNAKRKVAGAYADSIIMNPQQEAEFWKKGQMLAPELIPMGYVSQERRGYY